jgi:hypothetical protein
VGEPLAQFGGGGKVFQPVVEVELFL